ncbi:MAG: CDP-alcohol phosphatidyltransferase family protein [Candidatus Diapherotrites archaeon]|nr:CDP-alcohol phosphatidyltransferase family protein [Candidatus Diapherotrites archaeon]
MLGKTRPLTKSLTFILAKPFVWLRAPPNFVSFLGIPLALCAAYFIFYQQYFFAFVFSLLAILMDFIDGSVAEQQGRTTYFGNYFETMMDKYTEVILLASFAFHFGIESALAVGLSLMESYAKPRAALVVVADNRDWPAIGEHADKLALFLVGLLAASFMPEINGFETMKVVFWILIAMVTVGAVQRILYAKKLIDEGGKKGTILPYLKKKAGHDAVE